MTLGVGPDTVVGVCVDRSLDLPVALLVHSQGRRGLCPDRSVVSQ